MTFRPPYFEAVRDKAARLWEQLERDPELAGPWRQLFNQVQSPRHVLSELLQNADDAGATEASVQIEKSVFLFHHNGEDFTEEHFASLCRFGYSNKRALHTIGFRGIGFKSTFSLGPSVELFTPTLAIRFHRQRFTEPHWIEQERAFDGRTLVRVAISDQLRQKEIEKNLQEWLASPISLLFFRNLRRMKIGNQELHWRTLGPGPIGHSQWVAMHEGEGQQFLLIRSQPESFPKAALTEIRQERLLGLEEELQFPPCRLEIVLGTKGRLYVVLPTGVSTDLPFACNAPFIQDPARLKIKDPETSPTNRWLLARAGALAASAMNGWLAHAELPLPSRANAYDLLPDIIAEDASLETSCSNIVKEAFSTQTDGKLLLLTESGTLTLKKQSIIIPNPLFEVWEPHVATAMLDESRRPPLSQHVSAVNRKRLLSWGLAEEVDKPRFLTLLQQRHFQRPDTWAQLLTLWAFVAPELTGYSSWAKPTTAKLVPVQGREVLFSADEVVRLGEKRLLQSDEDWDFLAEFLIVLNQNWPRFLAEQRRSATVAGSPEQKSISAAYALLDAMGLDETSNADDVVGQVAAKFFCKTSANLSQCVRFAQIAAKLNAKVGEAFRFATADGRLRDVNDRILFDENGELEELVPQQLRNQQILHPEYTKQFTSCSREEWVAWVKTGQSGLHTFLPITQRSRNVFGRSDVEKLARDRGVGGELSFPYVTYEFILEDWDFEEVYWRRWNELAAKDELVWLKVAERLLAQPETYWARARRARLLQVATTGTRRPITDETATPSWVIRFRLLPCLPDTKGRPQQPADLLRRTSQTESFMDVEPFLHGNLDCERNRPLLNLLGVRTTPTGPDRLLDCLRALSDTEHPPVQEVEKWYRRLDHVIDTCTTDSTKKIKHAFKTEKLILAQDGTWQTASSVFLVGDEDDVPGVALIRPSVTELSLWRKIDVADHPTVELAIQWLKGLPSGIQLSTTDARRVRVLLARHPVRVWDECGHWLNLAGEWQNTSDLSYALTMQSLVPWRHLHQWVKEQTADFHGLSIEIASTLPFSKLSPLASSIEDRLDGRPLFRREPERKEWLGVISGELCRIELDSREETERVRGLASRLAGTLWYEVSALEITPYIDGTPAGTPRDVDVIWMDKILYVVPLAKARLARRVPEELGRHFMRPEIRAALDYSFERAAEDVRDYLNENFRLDPDVTAPEEVIVESPPPTLGTPNEPDIQIRRDEPFNEQPEPAEDGSSLDEGHEDSGQRARPRPKPTLRSSLLELFARANGFEPDGPDRFAHSDGDWICRAPESPFPWERSTASGELIKSYLPIDCCFREEPLELEAHVWTLLEKNPDSYSLILREPNGAPVEFRGWRLRKMRDAGEITIHAAQYRIVFKASEGTEDRRERVLS